MTKEEVETLIEEKFKTLSEQETRNPDEMQNGQSQTDLEPIEQKDTVKTSSEESVDYKLALQQEVKELKELKTFIKNWAGSLQPQQSFNLEQEQKEKEDDITIEDIANSISLF